MWGHSWNDCFRHNRSSWRSVHLRRRRCGEIHQMKDLSSSEPETTNQKPETYHGEFITQSEDETFELAHRIGGQLAGGEVFLLTGDLGAGKTVFAKGLAA